MNDDKNTNLYIAVIVYESQSDSLSYEPLYEECFVSIFANTLEEAHEKTKFHTKKKECRFKNQAGISIAWVLKDIVDVAPVLDDVIDDETEIYTRHFRNYQAYENFEPLLSGIEL